MEFVVTDKRKGRISDIIDMKSDDGAYTATVYLDENTKKVLYPVEIVPVTPGVAISLDSDSMSSCSFPPSVPESMVANIKATLDMFHDIVKGAREQIRKEQRKR